MDRQGRGKAKKKRTGLVVLCVVAAVLAACAAVYFLVFDSLVFVTDSAYSAVISVKLIITTSSIKEIISAVTVDPVIAETSVNLIISTYVFDS